jgi:integrase/recombinase XerD
MSVRTNLVKKRERNGVTRLIIDFRYTDTAGKPCRFVRHAALQTRDGAEREAAEYYERAVGTGDPEPAKRERIALAAFWEGTFRPKVLPLYRANTRTRYEALWRQRVRDALGLKHLDEIDGATLRGFARSIELEKRQAKGPVNFVRTILREAAHLGLIGEAPRLPPGTIKSSKKLPSAPTLDEVQSIIAKADGWLRVALGLGVYGGLRSGEIRALCVEDVNLSTGMLRIVRTLSEDEEESPKGEKERVVPIVAPLAEILRPALEGKAPGDRVVLTGKGTTPRRQHVLSRLVELQERLGMERTWSVHALRHGFCSHWVRMGIGVEAVRALAGHASLQVTNRYVHANGADLEAAMVRGFAAE